MSTRKYAQGTMISARRSIAELEDLIDRFSGGEPTEFSYGTVGGMAGIQFGLRGRRIRLRIILPDLESFREVTLNQYASSLRLRSDADTKNLWQREVDRLWRSMVDVVKAKLVAIDDGITTLEAEFLSGLVLPSGETVGERMAVDLDAVLRTGELPALMPGLPAHGRVIAIGGRTA